MQSAGGRASRSSLLTTFFFLVGWLGGGESCAKIRLEPGSSDDGMCRVLFNGSLVTTVRGHEANRRILELSASSEDLVKLISGIAGSRAYA